MLQQSFNDVLSSKRKTVETLQETSPLSFNYEESDFESVVVLTMKLDLKESYHIFVNYRIYLAQSTFKFLEKLAYHIRIKFIGF